MDNVQFHLYISTSPCGDARIFSPHEAGVEGSIHTPSRAALVSADMFLIWSLVSLDFSFNNSLFYLIKFGGFLIMLGFI